MKKITDKGSTFNYYTDRYGDIEDDLCPICSDEQETIKHIFEHQCKNLQIEKDNLANQIFQTIQEALLKKDENTFPTKGLLYIPLKPKIVCWKLIRDKVISTEESFQPTSIHNRNKQKVPEYTD